MTIIFIFLLVMISFILLMPVTKNKYQTYTKEEIQKLKYDRTK